MPRGTLQPSHDPLSALSRSSPAADTLALFLAGSPTSTTRRRRTWCSRAPGRSSGFRCEISRARTTFPPSKRPNRSREDRPRLKAPVAVDELHRRRGDGEDVPFLRNPFSVGSWRFGTSRPLKLHGGRGCTQRFLGDASLHHPSSEESRSDDVRVPDRTLAVVCSRERRTLHQDATPVPVGRRGRTGIVSTDPVPSRWLQRRPDARAYLLGSRSRWPWLVRGTRAKENMHEARSYRYV
jgi:hypothetical protein